MKVKVKVGLDVSDYGVYTPTDDELADRFIEVDKKTLARWNKVIDEFWDVQNEIDEVIEEQKSVG